jgi:hypothetical protein
MSASANQLNYPYNSHYEQLLAYTEHDKAFQMFALQFAFVIQCFVDIGEYVFYEIHLH